MLGAGLCLALGIAQPSSALSLLDLANGASFDSGDGTITFSGFSVKVKGGKANTDLSTYDVTVVSDGFMVDMSGATKGKMTLEYSATGTADLNGVSLALLGAPGKSKAKKDVRAGKKKLAKIKAKVGETNFAGFDGVSSLTVKEKVQIKDAGLTSAGNAFSQNGSVSAFSVVPEPSSLMLLAPFAALAALRRRAQR
ncbi:MAG: hypothetical protein JRG85_13390 [Deltaproteobacteria bacterium]|nr:hypothetical protein [Deltaproteobacteria bacterium]